MTLTTERPATVETPSSAPSRPPKPPVGLRAIVGWVAVLAGLAAAGLLFLLVVTNDSGPSRTDLSGIVENGSVRAIEHRDELRRQAASPTAVGPTDGCTAGSPAPMLASPDSDVDAAALLSNEGMAEPRELTDLEGAPGPTGALPRSPTGRAGTMGCHAGGTIVIGGPDCPSRLLLMDGSAARAPLRFATVGSVDDGKSTLIGRLLHDSKSIFEDQLEHIEAVSRRRGTDYVDLALLTDGLRAEREQGITIDVAYRYFSTPARSFVIADCPGHVQYTRNAVTGASTADLALVLVDARLGILEQTRRHSLLVSLLGVPHLVICVNKMDLVGHDRDRFDAIRAEFTDFAYRLDLRDVTFIPISALEGDNVVDRSANMTWYEGPTLLHHLETAYTASDDNLIDVRFPVQYVVRPQLAEHHDYRGYAGTVAAGTMRPGDDVLVLPSGLITTIERIDTADGPIEEARPRRAVSVVLADDVDVSRGDMLCRPHNRPTPAQDIDAMLVWMDATAPLALRRLYTLKHTTRSVRAMVTELHYRLDVHSLHRDQTASELVFNEIGRVTMRATAPIFADDYRRNRTTGSFVLIDESTNQTVAAGMLRTGN